MPPFLPDTAEVRGDLLDYYFEVQRFDRDSAHLIGVLERAGELDRTIVIVTSDNGMPFPRAKATVYDGGVRVPLVIRWPGVAAAGSSIDAFASLTDLAPTILEAAGIAPPGVMTGRSLVQLLRGQSPSVRDRVFVERERHADVRDGHLSYPVRAIRTKDFLYIRNFRPGRWPAGDPVLFFAVGPFGDIDGGRPSRCCSTGATSRRSRRTSSWPRRSTRPKSCTTFERDPAQLENVAGRDAYREAQRRLRAELESWLREHRRSADDGGRRLVGPLSVLWRTRQVTACFRGPARRHRERVTRASVP